MQAFPLLLIPLLSFVVTVLAIPSISSRLTGPGWWDEPRADRLARRRVSRAGGLAWGLGTIGGLAGALVWGKVADSASGPASASPPGRFIVVTILLVGAGLVLGRLDDRGRLGARSKLALIAGLPVIALIAWLPLSTWPTGRLLVAYPCALLLGVALQIFDNHDAALALALSFGCAGVAFFAPWIAPAALAPAGAALALLGWNWPPARLYFGNVGSVAAGLTAAWLTLAVAARPTGIPSHSRASDWWLALLPFSWPLLDLAFVVVARRRRGVSPWVGGTDHTVHRLSRRIGPTRTALVLGLVPLLLVAAGLLLRRLTIAE